MTIRPMEPDERKQTMRCARRSFGDLHVLFISLSGQVFIAERDGEILGGIVLTRFTLGDESCGMVKWLFTDPDAQGQGVAGALVARGMEWFAEHQCTTVFTCIEGFNTASQNRFRNEGFSPVSFQWQLRHFGFNLARVWWHASHGLDIGHMLWMWRSQDRPTSSKSVEPARSAVSLWIGMVILNTLLFTFMLVRNQGVQAISATEVLYLFLAVTVVFGLRTLSMRVTATVVDIPVVFQNWESGFSLSALISIGFGGIVPVPGSWYPRSEYWRYQSLIPKLGPVAAAGTGDVLILGWVLFYLTGLVDPATPLHQLLSIAGSITRVLLVYDVLLPFFPMGCFNGKRIFDWQPLIWGVMAVATVGLIWMHTLG